MLLFCYQIDSRVFLVDSFSCRASLFLFTFLPTSGVDETQFLRNSTSPSCVWHSWLTHCDSFLEKVDFSLTLSLPPSLFFGLTLGNQLLNAHWPHAFVQQRCYRRELLRLLWTVFSSSSSYYYLTKWIAKKVQLST